VIPNSQQANLYIHLIPPAFVEAVPDTGMTRISFRSHLCCLKWASPVTTAVCFIALYASTAIVSVAAQSAEENRIVDMSTFSCAELLRMPLPQALTVVGWFDGYYAGLEKNPEVNVSMAIDKAEHVIARCREHDTTSVMTLFGQEFTPSR
jgi:hypothetical protein